MTRSDYVVSMIASYFRGDKEGFIEDCNALIAYEENKRNFSVASKMRRAMEIRNAPTVSSLSSLTVEPLNLRSTLKDSTNDSELFTITRSEHGISDVILSESTLKTLNTIIIGWSNRDRLLQYNLTPQNRLLFYGQPGTGKTYTAYAIARELGLEILHVRFDSLISSYLGETGSNLREVFEYANSRSCLLLLDELDSVGKRRDDDNELGELKRVVIALLQNIDFLSQNSILIACTNHEHLLDPAIWRRFNTAIPFCLPDEHLRANLIMKQLVARNSLHFSPESIRVCAAVAMNCSGAMLALAIDNAIRNWVLENSKKNLATVIIEELIEKSGIRDEKEQEKIRIARILRAYGKEFSLGNLSSLLSIPKSTLHKRLTEQEDQMECQT